MWCIWIQWIIIDHKEQWNIAIYWNIGGLENIILSEVNQRMINTLWYPLYLNLGNNINESTQSRNRVTDIENTNLQLSKGENKEKRSELRVWD